MTVEVVYAWVIIACIAVLCQKIYYFIFVVPQLRIIFRSVDEILAHVKDVTGFVEKRKPGEWLARSMLKQDVEQMKEWTQKAFVETLNKRRPPEIPERIIQRYGKAGDADRVFGRLLR